MIWYYFDGDGTRDAIEYNGNVYYYMYNPQGDVIGLFDDNLNVVVEYRYDSWGKILSITGSLASTLGQDNPFRYRGYYYDNESGLYYLNSRYYHPQIGRFINADSVTDGGSGIIGTNLFVYAANNPVANSDPSGNFVVSAILTKVAVGAVTGAILGAVSNTVSQLISNGWEWKNLDVKEIGRSALVGGITGALSGGFSTAIGLAKGAGAVAQCAAKIFTNGVISAGGYTLDTILDGEKPTYSGQVTALGKGMVTTAVSIKLSSMLNNALFDNYTKNQKHIALGGTISHRDIRNNSYNDTDEYLNFLVSKTDNIQEAVEFTVSIFESR